MIITPDILRRDTIALLKQIDLQIVQVQREATRLGIEPHQLRDSNNNWPMVPLLQAKAQAYGTLVLLQTK